jgi:hypothetical protein
VAIITEESGLLIVGHYLRTAALAAVQVCMINEVLLDLDSLLRDAGLGRSTDLFYFIDSEGAQTVFTVQLLGLGIEFQIRAAIRAFILY